MRYGYGYGYPYYGSVRVPDPLPAAAWTCPECGEHRAQTSHAALDVIERWKRNHLREHRYEKLSPELEKQARAEDKAKDQERAKRRMEMFRDAVERRNGVFRLDKPKPAEAPRKKKRWWRR